MRTRGFVRRFTGPLIFLKEDYMKLKNIGSLVKAIGKGVDEYGPQIMAVGSAVRYSREIIGLCKTNHEAIREAEVKYGIRELQKKYCKPAAKRKESQE